jgi:glycosyltransferase involved in cell wall biosynthesis
VIEAQLRGRPVLGANVGGIPDLVADGVDGVLTDPDSASLAAALAILDNRPELARLARNARAAGERWLASPDDYAERMRELVEA